MAPALFFSHGPLREAQGFTPGGFLFTRDPWFELVTVVMCGHICIKLARAHFSTFNKGLAVLPGTIYHQYLQGHVEPVIFMVRLRDISS